MISFSVQNYSNKDREELKAFYRSAEKDTKYLSALDSIFDEKNHKPGYSPEKDLFLAKIRDKVVAVGNVIPETRIGRIVLEAYVLAASRRMGISRMLFEACIERGRQHGARLIHVCISEHNSAAKKFLSTLQFSRVRCYLELETVFSSMDLNQDDFVTIKKGHLKRGDEKLLKDLQNAVFSDSWGFCPNTEEEIRYYLKLTACRLEDILIILDKGKLAGYLWPHLMAPSGQEKDRSRARIHMFGVHPDSRGKGLGQRLLASGLDHLYREGAESAALTVDSENKPALFLYESFFFKVVEKAFWYEKRIESR
jgi:mycothiol synthase